MCMDDFNTPVSVRLALGRHTASGVPKSGEAGQRKVALRGGGAASGMASAKELDVREPSARISRRMWRTLFPMQGTPVKIQKHGKSWVVEENG
jgi:hypothetical protein